MDPYATHQYFLAIALKKTLELYPELPILECGCGDYSSPLIAAWKGLRHHFIWSADPDWSSKYAGLADAVVHVPLKGPKEWDMPPTKGMEFGLCFMDSEESVINRASRIPELLNVSEVVVMHDAREDVIPEAKYAALLTIYRPWTWIGSNVVNVREWLE